jgi:NADH dehydrogenase FAD-containing subunit
VELPADIIIDVYAFPRYTVLPQYAAIGYVPRNHDLDVPAEQARKEASSSTSGSSSALPTPPLTPSTSNEDLRKSTSSRREFIHASVVRLDKHSVTYTRPGPYKAPAEDSTAIVGPSAHFEGPEETLEFDYCIYALGAALPDPTNPWSEHPNIPQEVVHDHVQNGLGSKKWGVRWMEKKAKTFEKADRIVIVGAGALGIREWIYLVFYLNQGSRNCLLILEFASDLKYVYPSKTITLLHSRTRVMPIYPQEMHDESECTGVL